MHFVFALCPGLLPGCAPFDIESPNVVHLVAAPCQDPQLYGFQFNTIGVSDGMSMGTKGMMYSLPSRES